MSSYVVLARKWRSAQFSDIVGQGPIVRTLMNAIRTGRIHQAYLLTGSRGIGKTSIARIFAKAVRCENVKWTEDWLVSCGECSSCKEITSGSSVEVIEIDGASNNGVDAVREIRENAKYLPSTGARKIYIIDEVHMLTTAAFNALLKTLEEPPAHVIFIFATTEPHKIPATILSRTQRFDLRRHTVAQIQGRLTQIVKAENIQAETGALALLARAAEGSMRDGLSLLDQVIAFSGSNITAASVRESIGLIEGQTLLGILSAVFSRKPVEAIQLVSNAYAQGHDLRVLTRTLIEFLYGAILAKVGSEAASNLELAEDEWQQLKSLAQLRSLEEMELIFQALNHAVDWIARSPQPKIVLDVVLIKCASAEALFEIGESVGGSSPASPPAVAKTSIAAISQASATQTAASIAEITIPDILRSDERPAATLNALPSGPRTWEGLISYVRIKRPLLATFLEHGTCEELPIETDSLLIAFPPESINFRDQLGGKVYSEQLATHAREYFGKFVKVRTELKQAGESLAQKKERERTARETAAKEAASRHPIITEARSLFGGELGPIEIVDTSRKDEPDGT